MTTTDLKRIDHVIDRSEGRPQSEYWGYYDGQLIGIKSTNGACEKMLDEYAYDLLSSDLVIPATTLDGQCGDCGATLDNQGLCGCGAEEPEPTPEQWAERDADMDEWLRGSDPGHARTTALCDDCAHDAALCGSLGPRIGSALVGPCSCCQVENQPIISYELKDRLPAWLGETPRHTIFCVCSAAGVIVTPNGTLCGACYEAANLWQLWKSDSTAFVAELRRQSCRLNEMAVRLVVWLNAKNGSTLGADSVLAMWRQLLDDDDDPPKPRFYVVAVRRQVAA